MIILPQSYHNSSYDATKTRRGKLCGFCTFKSVVDDRTGLAIDGIAGIFQGGNHGRAYGFGKRDSGLDIGQHGISRKKNIEEAYKLKIFNLRAILEAVKMKPDERQAVEKQLQELQKERGAQIAELQAEKHRLVDAKVLPYKAETEQRMRDMAHQQHAQAMQQLKSPEERDKEMLDAAPKALNNALSIIDREIDRQQEKNDSLKKQINQDIESQAVKLAHERGYTIVFNKFRVNMKAEDITAAIIKALKKA